MPQLFPPSANSLMAASIGGLVLFGGATVWVLRAVKLSPYFTRVGVEIEQPVPFSHQHHVGELGIDCRYCHTTAQQSKFSGVPPTETCMTCHSEVWKDAPVLKPVRDSYATGIPLQWNRVHNVPDFVYFNHSAHVNGGVACVECHGRVDRMPLMARHATLHMKWCLDCHRHPEQNLVSMDQVFQMKRSAPPDPATAQHWLQERDIHPEQLTSCTACHR